MNFRLLAPLSVSLLLVVSVSLVGACSPTEDDAGGDGDGDSTGDGDLGSGGNPGAGGSGDQPGTGGNGDPGGAGGTSGSGGSDGTGGETPGGGGQVGGDGGNGGGGGSPGTGGGENTTTCATVDEDLFSFFATSHAALIRESGNPDGFGGDLGGLAGADAICQSIAEFSSPCQSNKTWRAFLSTSTEDAIDRIGTGPWYDRVGRLLANDLAELTAADRPVNAHPEIKDDFPNEDGVPNQYPEGEHVDNHQFLTGSGLDGRVYAVNNGAGSMCADTFSVAAATCNDWTTNEPVGCPRVGHSWPRQISGINWISVWNEGGCAPGGVLTDAGGGGPDGTRRVGSAGGYGGFYCFAVTGQ